MCCDFGAKKGASIMNKKVISVNYSIFGPYGDIDGSPDNISKTFSRFADAGFMPDTFSVFKIEPEKNTIRQAMRIQMVHKEKNCSITVLPDRVNISAENYIESDTIHNYLDSLVSLFDLSINRIALTETLVIENLKSEEIERLGNKMAYPANYENEENLFEFATHRVTRKHLQPLNEDINICRSIKGVPSTNEVGTLSWLEVHTDINTLGEIKDSRFTVAQCRIFFDNAIKYNDVVIDYLEGVIDAEQ